jgi:hypothetical protein
VEHNGGFPTTQAGLVAQGFEHCGYGKCGQCGQMVEWWQRPKGKRPCIPMSVSSTDYFDQESRQLHYAKDCQRPEYVYLTFDAMMEA